MPMTIGFLQSCLAAALGCGIVCHVPAAEPLTLDPAQTLIVTAEGQGSDEVAKAAKLLQTWLRRAYGTSTGFDVIGQAKLGEPGQRIVLALGPTRWSDPRQVAQLWQDGFLLERQGRGVTIVGGSPRGTLLGVVGFLDRFCGVRFYMPGDLFTSLPAAKKVVLDEFRIVDEPYVRSCMMSGIGGTPGDADWVARNGAIRRLGGTHQHNMFQMFPPDKYAAKYPDIYPLLDGTRYIPKTAADQKWQPCFSEPTLVDAAEQSVAEYFAQRPDHLYVAVSVNDGHAVCRCPRCAATYEQLKTGDERLDRAVGPSRLYWQFMNALAERVQKRRPDKLLVALAYGPTRIPPPFPLRVNIVVYTNFHIAELEADKILAPGDQGTSRLEQWLRVCQHYGNHDWYHGMGFLLPRIYTGFWSQYMRELERRGVGTFQHAEAYPNWGLDGPKYYILGRQWWNPQVDAPALWRQLCADLFGPAAAPMHEYFMTLEQLWIVLDNRKGERKLKQFAKQFLTDEEDRRQVARCRELLDRATAAAQTDAQKKRIALFSKTFRLSEYLFELAALDRVPAAKIEEVRAYAREQILPDPMTLQRMYRSPEAIDEAIQAVVAGKGVGP